MMVSLDTEVEAPLETTAHHHSSAIVRQHKRERGDPKTWYVLEQFSLSRC